MRKGVPVWCLLAGLGVAMFTQATILAALDWWKIQHAPPPPRDPAPWEMRMMMDPAHGRGPGGRFEGMPLARRMVATERATKERRKSGD